METDILKQLVNTARNDSEFFHDLVFKPEEIFEKLTYLTSEQKAALKANSPEAILGSMIGSLSYCGHSCGNITCACTNSCTGGCTGGNSTYSFNAFYYGNQDSIYRQFTSFQINCGPQYTCSCTSSTCGGVTCGGSTCSVTCSGDSCGETCGNSCDWTTNLQDIRSFYRF